MNMNPLVQRIIESLVRAALVAIGTRLLHYGVFDNGLVAAITDPAVVAAVSLVAGSVVWSIRSIVTARLKQLVAQSLQRPTTEHEIEQIVKTAIILPATSTPKNVVPLHPSA
jgi:hypothetical protein